MDGHLGKIRMAKLWMKNLGKFNKNFLILNMVNRWGIPKEIEELVKSRDPSCIYCDVEFTKFGKSIKLSPTWEHIVNDININGAENIALCCRSCNASKGSKKLKDWLQSDYCKNKGINHKSIALVAKKHLEE